MPNEVFATMTAPLLEVISERMMHTEGQERIQYWEAFQKLFDLYPYKMEYGSMYNRNLMANVLAVLAIGNCIEKGEEITTVEDELIPSGSFRKWSPDDWASLGEFMETIFAGVERADANQILPNGEDPTPSPELAQNERIRRVRRRLQRYIKCNEYIAPFRESLHEQIDDEKLSDDDIPKVDRALIQELWKALEKEEDNLIKETVGALLFSEGQGKDGNLGLKTIGELSDALDAKPFHFGKFDAQVTIFFQELCELTFGEPKLNAFFFSEGDEMDIERLRSTRGALKRAVVDPLEEVIRVANTAVANVAAQQRQAQEAMHADPPMYADPPGTRKVAPPGSVLKVAPGSVRRKAPGSARSVASSSSTSSGFRKGRKAGADLYKRKRTATRLEFEDTEEVDPIEEDEDEDVTLSRLPDRATVAQGSNNESSEENISPNKRKKTLYGPSQQKKYKGRRAWTSEDKAAIVEGLRKHGLGKWADIKEEYIRFESRTSVQIKDCFRSMLKRNEIPDDLLKMQEESKPSQSDEESV